LPIQIPDNQHPMMGAKNKLSNPGSKLMITNTQYHKQKYRNNILRDMNVYTPILLTDSQHPSIGVDPELSSRIKDNKYMIQHENKQKKI